MHLDEWDDVLAAADGEPEPTKTMPRLLSLQPVADSFEIVHAFPPERKCELVLVTERACQSCIELARNAGFAEEAATFLGVLGNGMGRLGRWSAAQDAYAEALAIRRRLAADQPRVYLPSLARTLLGLGNALNEQAAFAGAREAYEEALSISRQLAPTENGAHSPEVAMVLSNLSTVLRAQGELAAARSACEEALEIYRYLAATEPDAFLPDLAITLGIAGNVLRMQRLLAAAREAHAEARDIWRQLSSREPHLYCRSLATALTALGNVQRDQRDLAAARMSLAEAVAIERGTDTAEAGIGSQGLARALRDQATVLADQREHVAARNSCEEALAILRVLVASDRRAYLSDLALLLSNLGGILAQQGALAAARGACEEARDLFGELRRAEPGSHSPDVGRTLTTLGGVCNALGDFASSRRALEDALRVWGELASVDAQAFTPYMAATLVNLANAVGAQGDLVAARDACARAASLSGGLAAADEGVGLSTMAVALSNLGNIEGHLGFPTAASAAALEAVRVAEDPAVPHGEVHLLKGLVRPSYQRLLAEVAGPEGAQPDLVFRYLAAMRTGSVRATVTEAADGLAAAVGALAAAETRLKRPVRVVLVQEVLGQDLLAELTAQQPYLKLWLCDNLRESAGELAAAYASWGEARLRGQLAGDWSEANGLVEGVRQAAARAWGALPSGLRLALQPQGKSDEAEVLLSLDFAWGLFPFEILRFGEGEEDYLGLQRPLPRIADISAAGLSRLGAGAMADGAQALVVADPTEDLRHAPQEGAAVACTLRQRGLEVVTLGGPFADAATVGSVERALHECPAIFHYTGHGTVVETSNLGLRPHEAVGEEALCLQDGYLGTWALRDWPGRLDRALVVLNSCMTGRTRDFGGMREDLSGAFLRLGAEAVVASAFPVNDWLGMAFGVRLYAGNEEDLRERFLQARRRLARLARAKRPELWPGWALLTLHGNPFAHMPGRGTREGTSAGVLRELSEATGIAARELRQLLG